MTENGNACLEVIDALDGLFEFVKRSPTLDGSIPLSAAQGCKPFLDGNAAGFHLRFRNPAAIQTAGDAVLRLDSESREKIVHEYSSRIERLIRRGILSKDGYWHRELRAGFVWQKGNTLFLWSGFLVRPAAHVWLLVSGAFNRRCHVRLVEYVIADNADFVPVVLRLDLSSLRPGTTWLDTELACLVPLSPNVNFSVCALHERKEIGRAWCSFYDSHYLESRGARKYVGRYRSVTSHEPMASTNGTAECQLVIAGGARLHQIKTFNTFMTSSGWSRRHAQKNRLHFIVVRNIGDLTFRWDGTTSRDLHADIRGAEELLRNWVALYGSENLQSIAWLAQYSFAAQHGLPHLPITPWVFAVTPPGWSSLIDSYDFPGLDGMRGVISSDMYFGVPPLWQYQKTGRFKIPRGAPLARVLPVPRSLLNSPYREVSV